jgi:hypothetical protein
MWENAGLITTVGVVEASLAAPQVTPKVAVRSVRPGSAIVWVTTRTPSEAT